MLKQTIQTTEPHIIKMKCSLLNRTIEINVNPIRVPLKYENVYFLWSKIPEGHAGPEARRPEGIKASSVVMNFEDNFT